MPLGRVVIATSDDWIARLIAESLTKTGAEVVIVGNAAEALAHVRSAPTSVIVVDVGLPDHDGAWVATQIRADRDAKTTAVLLLSHPADDMRRVEALRAGADASLLKPFRVEEACQQIEALAALVDRTSSVFRVAAAVATPPSTPPTAASLEGNLAELSLPTVLTLLEMERRSGILTVNGVRQTATIELQGGAPTRATLSGADVAPIAVMRRVLRWKSGRFTFRAGAMVDAPDNRRSVAAFLIEAARLDDESPSSALETIAPPPPSPVTKMEPEAFPTVPFGEEEQPTRRRDEPPSSRRPQRRAPLPAAGTRPDPPPLPPPRLQATRPLAVPGIEDLEEELRHGSPAKGPPMLEPMTSSPSLPRATSGVQKAPPVPRPRPERK